MVCVGVGQKDGKLREERICTVKTTYRSVPVPVVNGAEGEAEEALADEVDKLEISKDGEKAAEANGNVPSPSISPALPSTVA